MKIRFGYSGMHMFDRASGLNALIDEIPIPEETWSIAPKYVSIALTNACDLTCSYCYAPKTPARLTHEQVVAWTIALDKAGCLGIGLGGGEPTIYPGFATLCKTIHEQTNLALTMTTHGQRFTSALADQLRGNMEFIRVSMDGIGPTYERLRGRAFASFVEKLEIVKSTTRFGINYVVNDDTINDLERAADFVFHKGAEEMLLLPETSTEGTALLSADASNRLGEWIRANYNRRRLATSALGGDCIDVPILMRSNPEFESFDFMHVDAFGTLKLSAFERDGVKMDGDVSIIDSIRQLRETRHSVSKVEMEERQ